MINECRVCNTKFESNRKRTFCDKKHYLKCSNCGKLILIEKAQELVKYNPLKYDPVVVSEDNNKVIFTLNFTDPEEAVDITCKQCRQLPKIKKKRGALQYKRCIQSKKEMGHEYCGSERTCQICNETFHPKHIFAQNRAYCYKKHFFKCPACGELTLVPDKNVFNRLRGNMRYKIKVLESDDNKCIFTFDAPDNEQCFIICKKCVKQEPWKNVYAEAYSKRHSKERLELLEENPEIKEKLSESRKLYYEKHPEARIEQGERTKKYFKEHPEARERSRKILEYTRENFQDKITGGIRKYWDGNEEARKEVSVRMKNFYAEHPEHREWQSEYMKEFWATHPELREQVTQAQVKYWEEHPEQIEEMKEHRKEYYEEHPEQKEQEIKRIKEYWDNPKAKQMASERTKKFWEANPELRKQIIESCKLFYEEHPEKKEEAKQRSTKYYDEHPELIQRLSEIGAQLWEDEDYKANVMKGLRNACVLGSVGTVTKLIFDNYEITTRSSYETIFALWLHFHNIPFKYEEISLDYDYDKRTRHYIPDFVCGDDNIIFEVKGYIRDKEKLYWIKKSLPKNTWFELIQKEEIKQCELWLNKHGIDTKSILKISKQKNELKQIHTVHVLALKFDR